MLGFFEDKKVGAVTCPILVRNKNKFIEKLQAIEYIIIAITRKLLEGVDAIYVTPGPLALYRKKALDEIGGFDEDNMTQDIEATWHLALEGWDRKMCLDTQVTTTAPNKFIAWYKQRERWNIGGLQTIWKYRKEFLKKGIVGWFILPLFISSTFLGLLGLSIFFYMFSVRIISEYLKLKSSFIADTAIITLNRFYFTPSVLNYLGIVLFIMMALFTFGMLIIMNEEIFRKRKGFNILFYMLVYMAAYPFIMVTSIIRIIKKDIKW
jgi:cellulose synthase/poly-beta-1,6-N-acetylglucosamine synthase-like glycosyltransferase